jgi:hypothetical protein
MFQTPTTAVRAREIYSCTAIVRAGVTAIETTTITITGTTASGAAAG